jgi:signal peptidase I
MSDALPIGRPVRRRYGRRLLALAVLVVAAVGLVNRHDVRYFKVTSGSMEPTLPVGARVTVDVSARTPGIGDIVAFHPPTGADPSQPACGDSDQGAGHNEPCAVAVAQESRAVFVKRVVAGPGDTIAIAGGHAVRNGRAEPEHYAAACGSAPTCSFPIPVRLGPGEYYLLGDNRGLSDDSRFWGPVPAAWIIGTVVRCSLLQTVCHRA